jgi:hypothetical protein
MEAIPASMISQLQAILDEGEFLGKVGGEIVSAPAGGADVDYTPQAMGAGTVIDLAESGHYTRTIDGPVNFSFTNLTAGKGFVLAATIDMMGMHAVTFLGATIIAGTFSSDPFVTNVVTGRCFDGSTLYLSISQV